MCKLCLTRTSPFKIMSLFLILWVILYVFTFKKINQIRSKRAHLFFPNATYKMTHGVIKKLTAATENTHQQHASMSRAIAKTSKIVKYFNYLYYYHKVCNVSRSYYSSSSSNSLIKPFSLVKCYNTLSYAPTNDFQTTNENNKSYNTSVNNVNNYDQNYEEIASVSSARPNEDRRLHGTIEELDVLYQERKLKEAVEVLVLLERNNVSVDINRYMLLMNECGEIQALEQGRKVHECLLRSPSNGDVWVCNKIFEMYAKCGSMEEAYKLFYNMLQRNVTSWDTMITGFAKTAMANMRLICLLSLKSLG